MSNFAVSPSVAPLPSALQSWLAQLLPQGQLRVESHNDEAVLVLATDSVTSLYALGHVMAHWAWFCRQAEEQLRSFPWLHFRFGDRTLLAVRPGWAPLDAQTPLDPGDLPFLELLAADDN